MIVKTIVTMIMTHKHMRIITMTMMEWRMKRLSNKLIIQMKSKKSSKNKKGRLAKVIMMDMKYVALKQYTLIFNTENLT